MDDIDLFYNIRKVIIEWCNEGEHCTGDCDACDGANAFTQDIIKAINHE